MTDLATILARNADRAARKRAYRETFAKRNEIIDGNAPGLTFEQMCNFTINAYLAALESDRGSTQP